MMNNRSLGLTICLGCVVGVALSLQGTAHAAEAMVVHEWGTFTCLQNEEGQSIGGLNTDDEPVPAFVHTLLANLVFDSEASIRTVKSVPSCDPDVTMRLETPVIYFYPRQGQVPLKFDVHVSFPGGWLTEFYPKATSRAAGFEEAGRAANVAVSKFPRLRRETVGLLDWTGLHFGGHDHFPQTTEKVWIAPREVDSTPIQTAENESEQFLFYRGVSCDPACLRVTRDPVRHRLLVSGNWKSGGIPGDPLHLEIPAGWLLEIRPDGTCAFKAVGSVSYQRGERAAVSLPDSFPAREFSTHNLWRLRGEMKAALLQAGLFSDEAEALLKTWQISYFQSPGVRLFYVCPASITDALLPLSISLPTRLTRVMVGRIEIVTPEQRARLQAIADGSTDGLDQYQQLGRFRNALVLDQQKTHPSVALDKFILDHSLGGYRF